MCSMNINHSYAAVQLKQCTRGSRQNSHVDRYYEHTQPHDSQIYTNSAQRTYDTINSRYGVGVGHGFVVGIKAAAHYII